MASKYVKNLEASVAEKSNAGYQKVLKKNVYLGPKGKSPGRNINYEAVAAKGKKPSEILANRSKMNRAIYNYIVENNNVKPIGRGEAYKRMTGGKLGKTAEKYAFKSNRQLSTAGNLKNAGY